MTFTKEWLRKKKELAQAEKLQVQPPVNFTAIPVSQRFNTGFGEDGINQPGMPVGMVGTTQGPRMIHEGEDMQQLSNGNMRVVSQRELLKEEANGMPGFQQGGQYRPPMYRPINPFPHGNIMNPNVQGGNFINPTNPNVTPQGNAITPQIGHPTNPLVAGRIPAIQDPNVQNQINIDPIGITGPNIGPIDTSGNVITGPDIGPIDISGNVQDPIQIDPINITDPIAGTTLQKVSIFDARGNLIQSFNSAQDAQAFMAKNLGKGYRIGPYQETGEVIDPIQIDPIDITGPDIQDIPVTEEQVQEQQVDQQQVSPYEKYFEDALAKLNQLMQFGSPAQQAAAQKQIDDLKATQAFEDMVQAQQMAQARTGEAEARTAGLVGARQHGLELAGAEAQTGIAAMQIQEQAAKDLAAFGLQGDTLAFAKKQYGDTEGARIHDLINQGFTLKQIQERFPNANITQADYDSIKFTAESSQWQQGMDFAMKQYGDAQIFKDIDGGMTFEQIKAKYPNVTQADYNSMKKSSSSGQWQQQFDFAMEQFDYAQAQDALKGFADAGDWEGFAKAFGSMFGNSIDVSHLQSEQALTNFYDGMDILGDLVASGVGWDEALGVLEASGALEKMGLTEGDAKLFYENAKLQADPLFSAMSMVDAWVAGGLIGQDEADDFMAIIKDGIFNPDAYKVEDGWQVFDGVGNEVGFFTNEADVAKFIADNPNKGYVQGDFMENHVSKTDGTGTGPDTTSGYDAFSLDHIPADYADYVSKDMWESLDSPKTWKEFETNLNKRIGELDDSTTDMTTAEKDLIINSLKMENKTAMKKYGVSEDNQIVKGIGIAADGAFDTTNTSMESKIAQLFSLDDLKTAKGKITTFTDGNGIEHTVIIDNAFTIDYPVDMGDWRPGITIVLTDVQTGQPFVINMYA